MEAPGKKFFPGPNFFWKTADIVYERNFRKLESGADGPCGKRGIIHE